jgi:capsular polysaccharide export protein
VRDFLQGSEVRFIRSLKSLPDDTTVFVWGRTENDSDRNIRTIHLEDGFLRSVGLGADLIRPVSWVMDEQGIYFDSSTPSDLESILQNTLFDEALTARATLLRERIVSARLTKYNIGKSTWNRPAQSERVILVPGQVETDASITFGAPDLQHNIDLLRVVREENPDAYIVYKPHPDVLAGLRAEGQNEQSASEFCDEVVTEVSMGNLLHLVDEVHVLTSLTGFEALLRGKSVTCYGQPFYAGWGLTIDKSPIVRRSRHLSLGELVAGALILHPVYLSNHSNRFTTPERVLDELLQTRESDNPELKWWSSTYRLIVKIFKLRR